MSADFKDDRTLWMGDLTAYMDANFIGEAFNKMGIKITNIKIVFDKYTGKPAGYCFVEVGDTDSARRCMLTVNGKIIPDSKPPVQFRLSFATSQTNPSLEHCILVSNLPLEVDDALLYNIFGNRYQSCRGARVSRNPDGSSKGSGCVRFSDETEQQTALVELNRFVVFGKSISLKLAPPRPGRFFGGGRGGMRGRRYDPYGYYAEHRQNYYDNSSNSSSRYNSQRPPHRGSFAPPGVAHAPLDRRNMAGPRGPHRSGAASPSEEDSKQTLPKELVEQLQLEDHGARMSVAEENRKFLEQSEEFYKALEESCWFAITSSSLRMEDL